MKSNVIVVGMARSGTSLAASIFARYGYFVSAEPDKELPAADKFNLGGYWELETLVESNVGLLKAVGFDSHNTWTSDEIRIDQAESIASFEPRQEDIDFVRYFETKQPWMWKDARFCYTLAYWWPLLNPDTTKILLVTRNTQDIWQSFVRTGWCRDAANNKTAFIRRIEDHVQFARNTIERLDIPFLEIDYGDYAKNPQNTATKLSDSFGLNMSASDLGYRDNLNNATLRGNVAHIAERAAARLPHPVRKSLKQAIPGFVARKLFPTMSKT